MANLMKKRFIWLTLAVVVSVGMFWYVSVYAIDVQKKLINFQGYLTDNASSPNPLDGTYDITFRIYKNPGDTIPLWTEHHSAVTVIRGNVSVLLGSITEMPLAFDEPRYLGIQVGNDPEMTPRQRLLPAFQATSANKLVVTYPNQNRSEFGVNNIVPVGGIIIYFGDPCSLPDNWRVCDGSKVNDEESPLDGVTLPDLRERFVRCESDIARNLLNGFASGGQDTIDTRHTHTISTDGGHSHSGSTSSSGSHAHDFSTGSAEPSGTLYSVHSQGEDWRDLPWGVYGYGTAAGGGVDNLLRGRHHSHSGTTQSAGTHNHTFTTSTNGNHNHGGATGESGNASQDNRPAFVALHYIIRIK